MSSDVDRDGGKLILSAGAPVASPDDDDRMLHALRDVVGREWPLEVRAGVNRGPVFSADIGEPGRGVVADGRRREPRRPGHGERAARRRARHACGPAPGPRRLRTDPGGAVQGEGQVRARAGRGRSALPPARGRARPRTRSCPVGRERLRTLRDALDAARTGERRVIELVGEPGIGKSRLVTAVREETTDMNVLPIEGGPYASRTPYLAMRRGLRAAVLRDLDDSGDIAVPLAERARELDPTLEPWLP